MENTILTNSLPDNCVIIEGNHVVLIANFVWEYEKLYVIGRRYLHQENYFSYPLPSSNIYEIVVSQLSHTLESFEFCQVKYKCIRIPTFFPETGSYFVSKLLNLNINWNFLPLLNKKFAAIFSNQFISNIPSHMDV